MAQVVYYVASSIDGFIAPDDGSLDWLAPFSASGADHGYTAFYASVDALVVGSRTYEQMLTFGGWPHLDRPTTVMTSRSLPLAADNISLTGLQPGGVVEALAASGHDRVWLMGGGALAGAFETAGLINEYVISYVPVILGSGRGLFGDCGGSRSLVLLEASDVGDGIVQCRYRRGA
jgi:dihydrofolate reductase